MDEISEMAQALADMFRYNTSGGDEIVTLQEELVQIDDYMKIQGIRFEDKIAYELDIQDEAYRFPLLKMTLQPLVENAVFHGIERKRGKGTIRISATVAGERLRLAISDDGVGISEKRLVELRSRLGFPLHQEPFAASAAGGGIGIGNVCARYRIRYGTVFGFSIECRKGAGTSITLSFPEA